MRAEPLAISDVLVIHAKKFEDARGFFSETHSQKAFAELGLDVTFVQDNHSYSKQRGVVRGLHFQIPPFAQGKLVRVTRGAVLDVAVDLRRASKTYGQAVYAELSAERWNQLYVPPGFAHGFCTLEPDTEVLYKVTALYSQPHDRGLFWADPALQIPWPLTAEQALLSDKDKLHPRLADLEAYF